MPKINPEGSRESADGGVVVRTPTKIGSEFASYQQQGLLDRYPQGVVISPVRVTRENVESYFAGNRLDEQNPFVSGLGPVAQPHRQSIVNFFKENPNANALTYGGVELSAFPQMVVGGKEQGRAGSGQMYGVLESESFESAPQQIEGKKIELKKPAKPMNLKRVEVKKESSGKKPRIKIKTGKGYRYKRNLPALGSITKKRK